MSTTSSMAVKAALLLAVLLASAQVSAATDPDGRSIYLDGLLASGKPLRGTLQNGVELSGAAAACVACHRRSGLGGGEGQVAVRPIAGHLLFGQPRRSASRPPYQQADLARALREGVDPTGRKLDALMPRYELDDKEVAQLAAYLGQLAQQDAPGVSASEIHFATVIAPGVAPEREQAMLGVLRAFFAGKNGGTRLESQRREIGRKLVGSEQMYRAYRKWRLHVWHLSGPPQTWRGQMERFYRRQPVFALLGGAGASVWQPVHDYCEHYGIPCLFPSLDYSGIPQSGYATFYFSRGAALEAEVLARHLASSGAAGSIVQVFRDDERGRAPARVLRAALRQRGIGAPAEQTLSGGIPSSAFWEQLLEQAQTQTLVLWLDDADLASFPVYRAPPPQLGALYLSTSLVAQPQRLGDAGSWADKVRVVDQFETAQDRAQRMTRMHAWLRSRKVPLADERIQANTYFAATLAGDALAHMEGIFSRDYFIERVEHMAEQSLLPSVYPRLSLGPGQRFASKGGYVAGFAPEGWREWIVP